MSDVETSSHSLLDPGDPLPVGIRNETARSPFLLICDHAGNAVPAALDNLGLPQAELDRHIGIDIGILGVSERLSDLLEAPLVFQRYSRLVVECNRRHHVPELIAAVSDGTAVPGNADVDAEDRRRRIAEIVAPYHREITARLDRCEAEGQPTVLISMHSFTPSLRARPFPRPWHVGLCYGANDRFSRPVLAVLEQELGLVVGRNEPYGVDVETSYSIPVYGEERGLPYVEFEIRQDLIADPASQREWGDRVAGVLRRAYDAFAGG